MKYFFLCNTKQICLAQEFDSLFMIQTNITFNNNHFNLALPVFVDKINFNKTFYILNCVIISKFIETFAFITQYINDLF